MPLSIVPNQSSQLESTLQSIQSLLLRTSHRERTVERGPQPGLTIVKDQVDLRFRSLELFSSEDSQTDAGSDVESVAEQLQDDPLQLDQLLGSARLLAKANPGLARGFVRGVRAGLEAPTREQLPPVAESEAEAVEGDVLQQITRIDIRIKVKTKSVTVESAEGEQSVVQSLQKVQIKVRFFSLTVSGQPSEGSEPVAVDIEPEEAVLQTSEGEEVFPIPENGEEVLGELAELANDESKVD